MNAVIVLQAFLASILLFVDALLYFKSYGFLQGMPWMLLIVLVWYSATRDFYFWPFYSR